MADLSNTKVGDKIAIKAKPSNWHRVPFVEYKFLSVTKRTATQIVTGAGVSEMRFRISDGRVIGENYFIAIPATPEMIEANTQQIKAFHRYTAALYAARGVAEKINYAINNSEFSTEQLEAVAAFWSTIKPQQS